MTSAEATESKAIGLTGLMDSLVPPQKIRLKESGQNI
jgi:hypothetical protein